VDEVVEKLRALIEDRGLSPGERFPTEGQLVRELGVSRNTLREAIGRLEAVGVICVRHGLGMFVGGPVRLHQAVPQRDGDVRQGPDRPG
jgi:DNA-binding FadR family transcriptional regulator